MSLHEPRTAAAATRQSQGRHMPANHVRKDIQALRALAVAAVVLNHLWPLRLTGGYVGVDVFFVVSGFLITSHLTKELFATGRTRFAKFYARRILRLLPAAFLVIIVSCLAVWAFLPHTEWRNNAQQLFASAAYVENWVLAAKSVDYSALNESATAAQHYWSLSVEEQFYLCWPLLLAAAALLSRLRKRSPRVGVTAAVAIIGIASFAYCVYLTATAKSLAYFSTPVRVWEFAAGAAVALALSRIRMSRWLAESGALIGFALIATACVTFDEQSAFPGVIAVLPVAGTVLVIASGSAGHSLSHERLTGLRPVQVIGDVSYSIYLWHWPLIVIAPAFLNHSLTTMEKGAIALVSVALAWLTKTFVEDPGRRWAWAVAAPGRPFVFMTAGVVSILGLTSGLLVAANRAEAAEAQQAAATASDACAGARALANKDCRDPFGPADSVVVGKMGAPWFDPPECRPIEVLMVEGARTTRVCDFSAATSQPKFVWLIGDSHAEHWQSGIFEIARAKKWRVTVSLRGGCPPAAVDFVGYRGTKASPQDQRICEQWARGLRDEVLNAKPDAVIVSAFARAEKVAGPPGATQADLYRDGFQALWQPWLDAGIPVTVIADAPLNSTVRSGTCTADHPTDPLACVVPRRTAMPPDPMVLAARSTPGVHLVDLTDQFCDAKQCYAVIGRMPVYYDADHLNRQYVNTLVPVLEQHLPAALRQ